MTPPRLEALLRRLHWQPQRAVGALALVLGVVLCALVANDLQRDYDQQFLAASAKTDSLTQLLEEQARQSMRRVELALSLAAQEVQTQYQAKGKISATLGQRLQAYLPQDGLIASFAVVNRQGQAVASTLTDVAAELPVVTDRDYFVALSQPGQSGIFVGQAVKSRISGLWIIPVSIRLEGGFTGFLVGAVDPEYFQHLYQSIDTGDNGFVTLFSSQGWAVARWPFNSEIAEHNWRDSALFKLDFANAPVGVLRKPLEATGIDSVYSYRALPDYPLLVALGLAREEILQPWRERALYEAVALLLVLAVLAAASALLIGQLRRRMQVEAALQLSEISLLKSSLPTLWIGSDARILRVNQAACALHAMTEAQLLSLTVPDLNPGMPMQSWPGHWKRLRQLRNMRFETVHRNGRGEDVPVEVELNFIEFEGREYNFSFIRDLTLRKHDENEVQRSAALLRSAIDAVDEAFVLFGTDDRMVYCNAKYTELYPDLRDVVVPGARFEDMIRIGARRGLYRDSVGREEEWIAERMRAHLEGNETRIQKRDDGRVLRVIDRRTPDGSIAGIRVDITDMVRATEEAQEASRYKSQFLANMSHEIRTPMNAILGLLTLLQNTSLSSTQRDYATKTEGAAQSLLHLLNDILDFSKVEAGKMELDTQPLRLERMLRDIAVILSSNMSGKSIELLFDIAPDVPAVVLVDAMRLQQVLVNLGGNAIKFTEKGQVVLRVRKLPDTQADANGLLPATAVLEFSLADSGIGIAPEQQEHIFSGFSQAEASTTRRFGGSGLGLAISRRLVELLGGKLDLHSMPGLGSTFSFSLRLPVVEAAAALPQHTVQQNRVLVVDDNPVARAILSALTRAWSWPTQEASSGLQALELLRQHSTPQRCAFDVIFLDWQMPDLDGWDSARHIRQLCAGMETPPRLVMLSAHSSDSLQLRTAEEQALIDGFLFKPATPAALHSLLLGQGAGEVAQGTLLRSSNRPLAGLRILVVEDNLINQQVAEELLNAQGALVSLAANGQLGVDAVAASQPGFDVVLMDIQMPVLDGYGATRKIREELGLRALPIVAMTANAMASDRLACLAAGMNEHVGKPFDMDHLVAVLLQVTGREAVRDVALAGTQQQLSLPLQHRADDAAYSAQAATATAMATAEPAPAPSPSPLASPYLDVAGALERISGLTSLYVDIAGEFLLSLDGVEAEFRQAASSGEPRALVAQMHTLKGTSATLGATRLSQHAAGLEKLFRSALAVQAPLLPPEASVPESLATAPALEPLQHLPALNALVQHTRRATVQALAVLDPASAASLTEDAAPADAGERLRAHDFLRALQALLAASDMAALDQFAHRGTALQALSTVHVDELQEALRGLDLPRAQGLCAQHMAALA